MEALDAFVSALIGLVVGTIFGGWVERMLYRPRVTIEIERASPYLRQEGKYLSIVVSNNGRTAAQDCVGAISIFELEPEALLPPDEALRDEKLPLEPSETLKPEDQLLTPDSFRPIDRELLCWAYLGNPSKYTINPGTKTLLDVFKAIEGDNARGWYLIIPSEAGWRKPRARLRDRHYRGEIVVSPANDAPTVRSFEIHPSEEGPRLILGTA